MFHDFSFGKGDVFLGSSLLAGILSLIPGLKEALQITFLIIGCCSGIASFLYYRAATKKLDEDQ